MKDDDALVNNPQVSRKALEAIHSQLYGWALTRCGFDRSAAEDLMPRELLRANPFLPDAESG